MRQWQKLYAVLIQFWQRRKKKKKKVIEPRGVYVIRYASHNHKSIYTHIHRCPFSFLSLLQNLVVIQLGGKNAAWNRQNLLINDNLRPFSFTWRIDFTQIHTRFYFLFLGSATCFLATRNLAPAHSERMATLDCSHVTISVAQCSRVTERFSAKKWERHHGVPGSFSPLRRGVS